MRDARRFIEPRSHHGCILLGPHVSPGGSHARLPPRGGPRRRAAPIVRRELVSALARSRRSTAPTTAAATSIGVATAGAADGTWSDLAPPLRSGAAAAYDAAHDRVLLVGGTILYSIMGVANDVWELRPDASPSWRRLATTGNLPPISGVAFAD